MLSPSYELGELAAKLALKRIQEKRTGQFLDEYCPEDIVLPSVFIEGGSVKNLRSEIA